MELLEAGVEKVLDGGEFKRYLAFAARFHNYSANNTLLILVQRPSSTRIAGYRTWQSLGRQVRRGEEGLKILAPIFRTVEDEDTGHKARILRSFKVVKVFDVSQTDPVPGAELSPERPQPKALRGDSEAARTLSGSLRGLCEAEGLAVRESGEELDALCPGANGLYSRENKLILLRETLGGDQKAKSLTHEVAHHLLHRDAPVSEAERPTLEAEAEGTAYAVLSYFGVDASGYSFAYVAHWAEEKELVKAVLSKVQKAAHEIIESVEGGRAQKEKAPDHAEA
jgi:hypothetical protein